MTRSQQRIDEALDESNVNNFPLAFLNGFFDEFG